MPSLFRSLFPKTSPAAAALDEQRGDTDLPPQNLVHPLAASVVEPSVTLTWEDFWSIRDRTSGQVDEDREAIETLLTAQIEWLSGALSLLQPHDGISTRVDVGVEVRRALSAGLLNEGSINAAVAKVLRAHFWPRVEGTQADVIRAEYTKHSTLRPAARLLTGTRPVPAAPTTGTPSGPRTVATKLSAEVLDELTRRHDLADEDLGARTADIQKRMYEQQAKGADLTAAASTVLNDLDRYVRQQQSKYRVNAKRGVKTENMVWRSRTVVAICGCQGCISARTQQTPWVTVEKLVSPEFELRRELTQEVQSHIPRKYLEILRLELIVADDWKRDPSPHTCHKERVRRMVSLIVSLFDTTSDSPEISYLNGLHELLTYKPSLDGRQVPSPRQIGTWQDAEENAAEWMRYMGYVDARVTNGGADGGIDVASQHAVAQVKREAVAVGSPMIQKFYGAANARGDFKYKLFFSASGYSRTAQDDAQRLGIALFNYVLEGRIEPVNGTAAAILHPAEPR